MVQELIELKSHILAGNYEEALNIVDELEGMSKQAILRNIESFLIRLLIHLIKNQIEHRLTNSWAASIVDSLRQIQKLNLKDNKTSYYLQQNEWQPVLEEELEAAINPASVEIFGGMLNPLQLSQRIDREAILAIAQTLLNLTYQYSRKELPLQINTQLAQLPGGEDWISDKI